MAYSVQADLEEAARGSDRLIQLTDNEASGALNTVVMDAAIARADAWIDSFAQRKSKTPFTPVPDSIKYLSAEEAVYLLKRHRNMVTEPETAAHEERLEWLRDFAAGKVSAGTDPVSPKSTAVVPEVLIRSDDEEISRESLKGFY